MIKNIKRALVIPILFILSVVVWIMWGVILSAEWVMESIEHYGDKLFNWAQK
jgi:hypothetical protein